MGWRKTASNVSSRWEFRSCSTFTATPPPSKQLLWERPENERFDVNGYREEGTTTTPFDMQVRNKTSRWHLVILAAQKLAARNPRMAALAEELIRKYEHKLREHHDYVRATSIDPPEILNWRWKARPADK